MSHLPFLSKVLEKVFFQPFLKFLEKFQSGFRSHHNVKSALLKVHSDNVSVDANCPIVLVLLDLMTA